MKKVLYLTTACLMLSACGGFNEKQPIDSTYYKNTQSVAWPEQKTTSTSTKAKEKIKKAADTTAKTATKVAEKASTVSKTITTSTTTTETTTYVK